MPESTAGSEPVIDAESAVDAVSVGEAASAVDAASAVEAASVGEAEPVVDAAADAESESGSDAAEAAPKRAPDLTPVQLSLAIEVAKTALYEITEYNFIGDFHEAIAEDDQVYSLRFVSKSPGFTDWWWTVTMTQVSEADAPTVLECGLLPGEDALLAPEWVPWAKRLAKFRATHDSHGNLLPETDESSEGEETPAPRMRTRKRTRTRLRRRGDSATVEAEASADADADVDAKADVAAGADGSGDATSASGANDSTSAEEPDVAADIRDFADEMDEVLHGITFEEGDDPDGDDSDDSDTDRD